MTKLVGIVNLTPDSFSGDGVALETDKALARIDAMMEDGASVIDIGAESTRPGATALSAEEEWQRLEGVVSRLGKRVERVAFSIDTRHASVAGAVLKAGFRWVNDVSAGSDPAMMNMLKQDNCTIVIMHALTIPADPNHTIAPDADPVEVVLAWGRYVIGELEKRGVPRARIVLDPGIGFGKTSTQSLLILRNIAQLKTLGVKLLVGHSRKSFLSLFSDKKADARDPETLAVSYFLAGQGVDYLRVHDVASHRAMLAIRKAL